MGKDLKGRDLGVGIAQRKDGRYSARFTDKNGKRQEKYFKKLQECRQWLADARFLDEHSDLSAGEEMTVEAWFDFFLNKIKGDTIRPSTRRNYVDRYEANIREHIGKMLISDVKPIHCQEVLNSMVGEYRENTIRLSRTAMYSLFEAAVENDLIASNPVRKSVRIPASKKPRERRALTVEEQKAFLDAAFGTAYYNQYSFLLQTGLRAGEMIGLRWSDIDFKEGIIHIRRTMGYDFKAGEWQTGLPKTKKGYREIPMTQECRRILLAQKEKVKSLKVIRKDHADHVFLNGKGELINNSAYNSALSRLANGAGIEHFSMHTLRHTYATRCIEAGMRPKSLQMLLGHSDISITMDLYVHVTDEEKRKEVERVEKMLNVI